MAASGRSKSLILTHRQSPLIITTEDADVVDIDTDNDNEDGVDQAAIVCSPSKHQEHLATKEDMLQLRNMIGELLGKVTVMSERFNRFKNRLEEDVGEIKRKHDVFVTTGGGGFGGKLVVKDRHTQTGPDLKSIQRQMTEDEDKSKRSNLVFAGVHPGGK